MTDHRLQGPPPSNGGDRVEEKTPRTGPTSFGPGDLTFEGDLQTLEELRADLEGPAG